MLTGEDRAHFRRLLGRELCRLYGLVHADVRGLADPAGFDQDESRDGPAVLGGRLASFVGGTPEPRSPQ